VSGPLAGSGAATVTHLRTTPIKGFTMRESPALLLTETGVVGDRAFFMVDDADKLMSATRTPRFLPYWARFDPESEVLAIGRGDDVLLSEEVTDGEPVRAHFFTDRYATGHVVPGPWSDVLSEVAGQHIRLVRAADPLGGFDVHRVSLASEASVEALAGDGGAGRLDGRRFRMTVMIQGVPPFTEDTWTDGLVQVGASVVRVEVPIRRCAAVQKHPDGLESRVDPLRRIKEVRGAMTSRNGRGLHLGVYGEVVQPGLVRVGDVVRRVDARV
jgi:uncharacterized protein YcbX